MLIADQEHPSMRWQVMDSGEAQSINASKERSDEVAGMRDSIHAITAVAQPAIRSLR